MIKKKILSTDLEYTTYHLNFRKSLGANSEKTKEIALEYFRRSHVVGYFQDDQMVAGYILCKTQPLRLPDFVPNLSELKLPIGFSFDQCQEIVAIWKDKSVSKHVTHMTLWPDIMTDFLCSHQQFLLGHTQSEKLYQHYDLMWAKVFYEGPSVFNLPSRLFFYTKLQAHLLRASSYALSIYYFLQPYLAFWRK